MAMGRRRREEQGALWIAASELPQSGGHPFYQQVNKILEAEGFDRFVEKQCRAFYAEQVGRPSLPLTVYFRMLLIGYFGLSAISADGSWLTTRACTRRPFDLRAKALASTGKAVARG